MLLVDPTGETWYVHNRTRSLYYTHERLTQQELPEGYSIIPDGSIVYFTNGGSYPELKHKYGRLTSDGYIEIVTIRNPPPELPDMSGEVGEMLLTYYVLSPLVASYIVDELDSRTRIPYVNSMPIDEGMPVGLAKGAVPKRVALGLQKWIIRHRDQRKAAEYTKWPGGKKGSFNRHVFTNAMNQADEIHVNLNGFDWAKFDRWVANGEKLDDGSIFEWELRKILTTPEWRNKARFYDGGKETTLPPGR
jgi:hypothetical protein